jgi:hypothetical protein
VVEVDPGKDFECSLEDFAGEGGVGTLGWDELGWVVGRELSEEEEVGGGGGFSQELDALADERGYGFYLFWLRRGRFLRRIA